MPAASGSAVVVIVVPMSGAGGLLSEVRRCSLEELLDVLGFVGGDPGEVFGHVDLSLPGRQAAQNGVDGHRDRFGRYREVGNVVVGQGEQIGVDRKSTRLNSSHLGISYAVFCLKK